MMLISLPNVWKSTSVCLVSKTSLIDLNYKHSASAAAFDGLAKIKSNSNENVITTNMKLFS
jgi:hypothetical protein